MIERQAVDNGHHDLMERAGQSAARLACDLATGGGPMLVLAGPGNNGGDAIVAARHLKAGWFAVTLVFPGNPAFLSAEARHALDDWLAEGGKIIAEIPPGVDWELIVDGLFGIGLERDLTGAYAEMVTRVNEMACPVLSLDVPSGLCSDTGRIRGVAVRASHTLSFIALKPGLLTHSGVDFCGSLHLDTLGLDALIPRQAPGQALSQAMVEHIMPPRPKDSHKGLFGSLGIVGGSESMIGAALLAGRAALKGGAGKVFLGLLGKGAPKIDAVQPELMLLPPQQLIFDMRLSCLAVGPGLGTSEEARQLLIAALDRPITLVLDADALRLLGEDSRLQKQLLQRTAPTLLTPHPLEAARLLGISCDEVQNDRVAATKHLATRFHAWVVLKGAGSICMQTDGSYFINTSGNPGMGSAGMGDVLTGLIGAFIAQGIPPAQAMILAVYLHGAAADELVETGVGPIGLAASEIIDRTRLILNRWLYNQKRERR
ncbi:MAG: NAD(P)H-hydrate dehydratase [Burkholderiales bacterium]